MAHKGKVTYDVTFNLDDLPEAYTNTTIQPRVTKHTTMAWEVCGSNFDSVREPLDLETIIRIGEGRKHGRYFVADCLLVPCDVPTLSQVQS
jgi:hypothetical protein